MKNALKNFFSIEDLSYRKSERDYLKEKIKIEEYRSDNLI